MLQTNSHAFEAWELVPHSEVRVLIQEETDLAFLGRENLKILTDYWQSQQAGLLTKASSLDHLITLIDQKTPSEIRALATTFGPPLPPITNTIIGQSLYPTDLASIERAADATTFRLCGWCRFCQAFSSIYHCSLQGQCSLAPLPNHVTFDTTCMISYGSSEFLQLCLTNLGLQKLSLSFKLLQISDKISYLQTLAKSTPSKPLLPQYRPNNWFQVNDSVRLFLSETAKFTPAKVTLYHEQEPDPLLIASQPTDCSIRFSPRTPFALSEWEYQYFKQNPEYLDFWFKCLLKDKFNHHELDALYSALTNPSSA